jgi:chromosome partitioning protein
MSLHRHSIRGSIVIVGLAGQKGGSGKTTTSLCIADEWHRRGHNVLIIDLDPQGTARTWHNVAGDLELEGPTVIAMGSNFHRDIEPMREAYDHIILDCPPKEEDTRNER